MKYDSAKNPIVVVLGNPKYQERYNKDNASMNADELIKRTLDRHDLDPDTDTPLPEWAFRLLSDTVLSFKVRAKMVMLHHFNMTGQAPLWGGMKSETFKGAPMKESEWLNKFREEQAKKAEDLIKKRKKGKKQ